MFGLQPEALFPILIGSSLILFGFMVWKKEEEYFIYAVVGAVAGFVVGVILSIYPY